ncbi:MAG: type II secretion system F family protein [Candidatus Micrarchaeia archaeon]
MLEDPYLQLSSLFPKFIVNKTEKLLVQGGFRKINARQFLGFTLFFSLSLGFIIFTFTHFFSKNTTYPLLFSITGMLLSAFFFYFLVTNEVDSRAKEIEGIFPNALQIISFNIKAGMTFENAVWKASRPEFGALNDEIKRASANAFSGVSIEKSLKDITKRVNSATVDRAVKLITYGLRLGGEMGPLLQEVAKDIRETNALRKEINTNTTAYAMFIVLATVIVAPILFSVTTFYADMNENLLELQQKNKLDEKVMQASTTGIPSFGVGTAKAIPSEDIRLFAISTLATTTVFSSIILSIIRYGKINKGVKYAPILLTVSLGLFFLSSSILEGLMQTIIKA